MTLRRVAVTEPVHPDAIALLRDAGWQVQDALPGAEAALVRTRRITPDDVAGLRMISKHGVGVDNVPLDAARAAGVCVTNTPGANAAAVAEQALMLLLALLRDLDGQRAGLVRRVRGAEGARLVVVGFGQSGQRFAQLALAMGMRVTVVAPTRAGDARAAGFAVADLDAAMAGADAVSLHVPLTDATRAMIGAAQLAAMAPGAVVVNCARGGIVDEAALIAALSSGHIAGAGLDVAEVEPVASTSPLRMPGVIVTPHAAGLGQGAFRRMGTEAARNVIDWGRGQLRPEVVVVGG
jgi:D-3-phosphoglycerate dehydrogenase / 2-oxoglutarate reductase